CAVTGTASRGDPLKFLQTELPGVVIVEPDVFRDARGFFLETFHAARYRQGGIPYDFVQDNHSRSVRGTLRGLHAQRTRLQGKLVRAVRGEIFDVAVDIRPGSATFGKWVGGRLSEENFRQIFVPPGFAHGFCVLSEVAEVEYKDRKSTRLNSSHGSISYAVFCLKKKNKKLIK